MPSLLQHFRRTLGCRIIGSAGYLNYAEHLYDHVDALYDHILIHSPKPFTLSYLKQLNNDAADQLGRVLKDHRRKVHFTGFIFDEIVPRGSGQIRRGLLKKKFKKLVFVSRGGGVFNDNILVSSLLSARKKREWFFVVCCGPATSSEDMMAYEKMAMGLDNVLLANSFSADVFDRYFAAADLCVSTSGYNTALKLLFLGKKTVFVPNDTTEQRWRAKLLRKYLPAMSLEGKEATADRLCAAMDDVLAKTTARKKVPLQWFDGASQTARMLADISNA